jgi:hypothetical protein
MTFGVGILQVMYADAPSQRLFDFNYFPGCRLRYSEENERMYLTGTFRMKSLDPRTRTMEWLYSRPAGCPEPGTRKVRKSIARPHGSGRPSPSTPRPPTAGKPLERRQPFRGLGKGPEGRHDQASGPGSPGFGALKPPPGWLSTGRRTKESSYQKKAASESSGPATA